LYNVFGMTRSLNPGPPALEDSTIPLGYRGGGVNSLKPSANIITSNTVIVYNIFLFAFNDI